MCASKKVQLFVSMTLYAQSIYPSVHNQSGAYSGPPPERFWGVRRPPLDFQNLKRKSTVTHHSNKKETKRKKEKEEYRFWSYDGQGNQEETSSILSI